MPSPRIAKEDLKQALDLGDEAQRPIILDARNKYPFEHSNLRLPGAVRMPPDAIDTTRLPKDRDIVVYDSDPDELVSSSVVARLIREGYRARALKGGIAEWLAADMPVEAKQPAAPESPKA